MPADFMDPRLDVLLRHPGIWRAKTGPGAATAAALPTGFDALSEKLPGGGWPAHGLVELLVDQPGVSELGLLLPALAELQALCPASWLVLVAPPCEPYAPALAARGIHLERLLIVRTAQGAWVLEQALRSAVCRAVVGWMDEAGGVRMQSLRRLQLAATEAACLCIVVRPLRAALQPSPAALRLELLPDAERLGVRIIKSRGRAGATSISYRDIHGF